MLQEDWPDAAAGAIPTSSDEQDAPEPIGFTAVNGFNPFPLDAGAT
jgi:hypothetical protein